MMLSRSISRSCLLNDCLFVFVMERKNLSLYAVGFVLQSNHQEKGNLTYWVETLNTFFDKYPSLIYLVLE